MDETGLKVFVEMEGGKSRLWCLWQSSTEDSCVFSLSPRHNADIPEASFIEYLHIPCQIDSYQLVRNMLCINVP